LDQISGRGFEEGGIRVSQCKLMRLFSLMIKKWQIGDQIHDHNSGGDQVKESLLRC
jgi:hypothetical protein